MRVVWCHEEQGVCLQVVWHPGLLCMQEEQVEVKLRQFIQTDQG